MRSVDRGSSVGEYTIDSLERTGVGGTIFRAEQQSLGRTVSLHVCAEPADSDAGQHFLELARRLATVDHRDLLPVYDVGTADGLAFAVTREPPGVRLDKLLAEGPLDESRAVGLAEQMAGPLEALAQAGLSPAALPPASVVVADEPGREHAYLAPLDLVLVDPAGAAVPSATPTSSLEGSAAALAALVAVMAGENSSVASTALSGVASSSPSTLVAELRRELPARARSPRRPGRMVFAGLAIVALALLAAAVAVVAPRLSDDEAPSANAPAGRIAATIALGSEPRSITVGEDSIWIARADGTIVEIDPEKDEVVGAPIPFTKSNPDSNLTLRAGEGALFALDGSAGTLSRIDPERRQVTGRVELGANLEGATVDGGVVWVTRSSPDGVHPPEHELIRVDASTLRPLGKPTPVGSYPLDVDTAGGIAWVTNSGDGTVTQVGSNGQTTSIRVGLQPGSSVLRDGTLWIPDFWSNTVTPLGTDAMELSADVVHLLHPSALAATADAVWAKALVGEDPESPSALYRIDPESGTVSGAPVPLGSDVGWITATDAAVWVPSRSQKALIKIVPTQPAPPPREGTSAARDSKLFLSGPIEPGTIRDTGFVLPYQMNVGAPGWIALGPERLNSTIGSIAEPTTLVMLIAPTQAFRADGGIAPARDPNKILRVLAANPNLTVGKPKETTVGGQPAVQVNIRAHAVTDYPSFCPEACVPIFGLPHTTIVVERSKPVRLSLLRGQQPVVAVIEQGRPDGLAETGRLVAGLRFDD